jgi:hypothetical protein
MTDKVGKYSIQLYQGSAILRSTFTAHLSSKIYNFLRNFFIVSSNKSLEL